MKAAAFIPAPAAVSREALIVIGGALIAAFIVGRVPAVRDWIKAQWGDTPHPF